MRQILTVPKIISCLSRKLYDSLYIKIKQNYTPMALGNNIKNDQLIPTTEKAAGKKSSKNTSPKEVTGNIDGQYAQILDALSKSQAVIEFNLDGTVITAN